MSNRLDPRYLLAIVAILALSLAGACASNGNESVAYDSVGYEVVTEKGADDTGGSGYGADGAAADTARPAATAAASAPSITRSDSYEVKGDSEDSDSAVLSGVGSGSNAGSASIENEIASATDGRVIIRTADLDVTVNSVAEVMDDISNITVAAGGWVVTSAQPRNYSGNISIRVPADRFEDVIEQLKDLAVKVKSVSTRSEDFTEEFTDVTARAQTLGDTLERLRILYDRAFTVEDAITIQKEITNVQSDLESLEARLNFLSQSSAFSFISVSLESVPIEIEIFAGDDIAAAVGHPVTYRAKFTPPEGLEDFFVTWNFGDGEREESTNRFAPTGNGDELISSPVIHYFGRDEDSPFIVTAELTGAGEGGIAEGEDTLVTTVSRLPVIEVFAGENQIVEAGSELDFSASFTRPEGIGDISYSWNFGDGSAPVEGDISSSANGGEIDTTHTYKNFRPNPYTVVLTVTGQTEVGEVEAFGEFRVYVRETIGVAAAELDAGSTTRDAVRTLQSVGVFLAKAALWLLILSPAWLIGLAVLFVILRRRGAIRIPKRGS
jgi:hypothetical protein